MTLCEQPDLAEFIQEHSTPYDPETDTYRRPPFAHPVKAGKNSPIYNAHSYHTKVPPEGIVPYIEHYTDPGDLVLDPFCGSGMTGVAALMTGRHAILNDLSPAAVHIAYNYCTPVDVKALKREFVRIKNAVREEFDWLYGTIRDDSSTGMIRYTVWSDEFQCVRCGCPIVFHDVEVKRTKKMKAGGEIVCPSCGGVNSKSEMPWMGSVPVSLAFSPAGSRTVVKDDLSEFDRQRLLEIAAREPPYWYPADPIEPYRELMSMGATKRGIQSTSDFYTKRNLWAFSALWNASSSIEEIRLQEFWRFALTAIIPYICRKQGYGGGGGGMSATLYTPSLHKEQNVLMVLERKVKRLIAAFSNRTTFGSRVIVTKCSATDLSTLQDNAIDYIFVDPPFGGNIYYADASILWESWLQDYMDLEQEIVFNRRSKSDPRKVFKTLEDYASLMFEAFGQMHRVLKPGRRTSVVFHNSDDRVWQAILKAAETAGFELAEINAFDKQQLSFKGVKGAKGEERVTNQDIVLNLLKPHPGRAPTPNGHTHLVEAEQRVVETVAGFLAGSPPPGQRTLQHLWNHVLYDLLRDGSVQVSMADVEAMLAYHSRTFKLVDGRYYLRGEAVLGGNVFDLSSDAGAIAWLTAVLSSEPLTTGELIPKWQQETASLGGVDPGKLDRLLEQNFWQDERTGRWRVPTAAQREKMSARADLSTQAHLRVVRRFLDGELDRRPSDWELSSWIRFCYNREFYAEAAALFPHITEARVDPDEYREIKRMVAVCRMRAGESKE
jgi:DNA modification methylase